MGKWLQMASEMLEKEAKTRADAIADEANDDGADAEKAGENAEKKLNDGADADEGKADEGKKEDPKTGDSNDDNNND